MSHLTQMAGLAVQNFVSAAVGLRVAVALIRGLVRRRSATIGNFWVDLTRGTIRLLLPLAFVFALVLVEPGGRAELPRLHPRARRVQGATQSIPGGPVASQEAIKELGENGGGFYNANSAHPFENPNGFTNFLEIFLLLMIPFALTYTYGRLVKDQRQGWVLFAVMFAIWIGGGRPRDALGGRRATRSCRRIGAGRRQHGGQGGPLRHRRLRPLRRLDDGHLDRRGQLRPRQLHAARRRRAARPHDARRGEPGRHGRRPLRDPRLRPALGLHRRADGRANARVRRQEDPGDRDEARRRLPDRDAARDPRLLVDLGRALAARCRRSSTPARTGSPRSSTRSRRRRTTTAPPSAA